MEIFAIIFGPVIAVLISLWLQHRYQMRATKLQLFFALMANRKSFNIEKDWAKALNLIDVVFAKEKTITQRWHHYYDLLCEKPPKREQQSHAYLELLSAIAGHLGYKNLQQTDIDKFYSPQGLVDQATEDSDLYGEFLRVLRNTERFLVEPKKVEPLGSRSQIAQ